MSSDQYSEDETENIFRSIEDVIAEKRMGVLPDPQNLEWWEWEAVKYFEKTAADFDRIIRVETKQIFQALLKRE